MYYTCRISKIIEIFPLVDVIPPLLVSFFLFIYLEGDPSGRAVEGAGL